MSKNPLYLFLLLFLLLGCQKERKILVYGPPESWSNPQNLQVYQDLQSMKADSTSQASWLESDTLMRYSALVLIPQQAEAFTPRQQSQIRRYLEAGGGLLSMGLSLNTPYQWAWGEQLLTMEEEQNGLFSQKSFSGGQVAIAGASWGNADSTARRKALSEALNFVIGKNQRKPGRILSPEAPEDNRFTKVVLSDGLYEPMELDILPDGKVIFAERRGDLKLYDPATNETRLLYRMDVCTEGNYEDGILGLALDPDFAKNNYLYLYYSPPCDTPAQFLSRFRLDKGTEFIRESEVVILKVPVQRETCCHSGGSVQFGSDGYLYLSTGDNTSSKESDGYAPLDARPGRGPYDAQKSSGNTHDLRGKILRIKVDAFGKYSVPSGNLFPPDGSEGRPEIYIMGARNPFRIAIDPRTKYLYWGDVGPDSGEDSPKYGPQSYDEWNQAREAGNYGWPYFQADNKPFRSRDFSTDQTGDFFDPARPVNHSPHNYGAKDLPPAKESMIWYPYSESAAFPHLGKGSRSAMAGPVFYQDYWVKWDNTDVAFPSYYNGKMFIYEWARSWVRVLSFDEEGKLIQIEPFLPEMRFVKPIDMEFGPDGAMYVLEYGENYFARNDEARLSRIEFHGGNRAPVAMLSAAPLAGALPHTVQFSASGSSDPDPGDNLRFEWDFEGEGDFQSGNERMAFVYETAGIFHPRLRVTDEAGAAAVSTLEVRAGNAPPQVEIALSGNQSFYFNPRAKTYQVTVSDPEDGSIDPKKIQIDLTVLEPSIELSRLDPEALSSSRFLKGKLLVEGSDCRSCHAVADTSIGPSFTAIANRYHGDYLAQAQLAQKVIKGGGGNWGKQYMAAHPQHSKEEAEEMVKYVLSLADADRQAGGLPLEGKIRFDRPGNYVLVASYSDTGAEGIPSLKTTAKTVIRPPQLEAENCDRYYLAVRKRGGREGDNDRDVRKTVHGSWIAFDDLDLTGIATLTLHAHLERKGRISLRIDGSEGKEIGFLEVPSWKEGFSDFSVPLAPTSGIHPLYLIFEHPGTPLESLVRLDWIRFEQRLQP